MKAANTGIGLLLAALFAGGAAAETDAPAALWETAGFLAPESALFDPDGNVIYVSNVNGAPGDKDGNGFISRVGNDGTVRPSLDLVADEVASTTPRPRKPKPAPAHRGHEGGDDPFVDLPGADDIDWMGA